MASTYSIMRSSAEIHNTYAFETIKKAPVADVDSIEHGNKNDISAFQIDHKSRVHCLEKYDRIVFLFINLKGTKSSFPSPRLIPSDTYLIARTH